LRNPRPENSSYQRVWPSDPSDNGCLACPALPLHRSPLQLSSGGRPLREHLLEAACGKLTTASLWDSLRRDFFQKHYCWCHTTPDDIWDRLGEVWLP